MDKPLFDLLPVEILRRVLAQGPCTNALALTRVNRRLHDICTDPLVYADIIENQGKAGLYIVPHSWWERCGPVVKQDWKICARWALADMKASVALDQQLVPKSSVYTVPANALHWLPELISKQHAGAIELCRDSIIRVDNYSDSSFTDEKHTSRLAFFGVCQYLLQQGLYSSGPSNWTVADLSWFYPEWLSGILVTRVLDKWADDIFSTREVFMQSPRQFSSYQNDMVLSADLLCMRVGTIMVGPLCYLLLDAHRTSQFQGADNLQPPTSATIPFASIYMDITEPFTTGAESACFDTQHLPVMTSAKFLEDDWVGYYTYIPIPANATIRPAWDAMMRNIHFVVSADYADHCAISSGGHDDEGRFTVFGTVHKRNGRVQMTKQYDTGTTWDWHGVLTPFGFIASWGTSSWGGWVWLWKRSWSPIRGNPDQAQNLHND